VSNFLDIDIDERSTQELLAIVEGTDIYSDALARSINRALTATRTASSKHARQRYTASAGDIRKSFSLRRANRSRQEGLALSSGRPIPLSRFGARETRSGVSVRVRKDRGRQTIDRSFRGRGSLRGTRVFRRTGEPKRPARTGRWKGTGVNREPIEQLFGPSVPQMIQNIGVQNQVLGRAEDVYLNTLDNELRRRLRQLQEQGRRATSLRAAR